MLIGRDAELGAVAQAIARGARVVTLVGGPGTGKSAIAAAFARAEKEPPRGRARRFAVVSADLVASRTAESIGAVLGPALGASLAAVEGEGAIATALGRLIASRGAALVVLDDADAVVEPLARMLASLAQAAPEARFLVTSRARLGIASEVCIEVPPLAVPAEGVTDAAEVEASEAVRLFVARASQVRAGYRIPAGEAATVAQIVRRLDGIPLAIELAAARVPVLGERAIAELLAERFDILEVGRVPAGRTLSRAIAWSWDLLDEDGRRALARAAIFEGSFDLATAAAVGLGRDDAKQARVAAAAELDKLEARSLLRVDEPEALPGERRFTMLASVRAFAADRLAERGEEEDARARLARHLAALPPPPAHERVARLALERGDLARAWETAMKAGDPTAAVRIALRGEPLALAHGPLAAYVVMLDATLARGDLTPDLAAEVHLSRGLATLFRGKRDLAVLDFEAARRLATVPDVRVLATSKLALVQGLKGRLAEAREAFDGAIREGGVSGRVQGIVLKDLANVLSEAGANDEAMVTLARARDLLHEAGELREEGFVTMLIGSRLLDEGRLPDARRDLEAALDLLRRAGDRRSEAWTTTLLAVAEGELGDRPGARARLEATARAFHAIGDAHTEGLVLAFAGNVALEQGLLGDAERAYRDARRLLEGAGDDGALGLVLAASAVVDRRLGHVAASRDAIARARALAERDGRAPRAEAVRVLAASLEDEAHGPSPARPDDAEELRFARRVVATSRPEPLRPHAVVAAKDGSWMRLPDGETVRLGRSPTLRAVVERLVAERLHAPGRPVPPSVLVRAGWPGERILPAAAKNRLHVTITRLRRLGLDALILHEGDGYLLDPSVDLRGADDL